MDGLKLKVGDLVKIKEGTPHGGQIALVYEEYPDFDRRGNGVSLITREGRDLGGWSVQEQDMWLTHIKSTGLQYEFRNVTQLSLDYRQGLFDSSFNQIPA